MHLEKVFSYGNYNLPSQVQLTVAEHAEGWSYSLYWRFKLHFSGFRAMPKENSYPTRDAAVAAGFLCLRRDMDAEEHTRGFADPKLRSALEETRPVAQNQLNLF